MASLTPTKGKQEEERDNIFIYLLVITMYDHLVTSEALFCFLLFIISTHPEGRKGKADTAIMYQGTAVACPPPYV